MPVAAAPPWPAQPEVQLAARSAATVHMRDPAERERIRLELAEHKAKANAERIQRL